MMLVMGMGDSEWKKKKKTHIFKPEDEFTLATLNRSYEVKAKRPTTDRSNVSPDELYKAMHKVSTEHVETDADKAMKMMD